jgi:hypothetical protein
LHGAAIPASIVVFFRRDTCFAALQALQSKFSSQRLGAFGTLLGDKAAEMTSMASQSFGDYLQPSAASSFFSKLTGKQ